MSTTLITSRDPRGLQAVSLFEAAYNKARLTAAQAQTLNERGGEFQQGLYRLIAEVTAPQQFSKEEVPSSAKYHDRFLRDLMDINNQIIHLGEKFSLDVEPALNYVRRLPQLPWGAEGWFAVVKWESLASTYELALEKLFPLAAKAVIGRPINKLAGCMGTRYLQMHVRTAHCLQAVADAQDGDIMIIPAQFGLLHRGQSARRVRELCVDNEFALDAISICCMLMTNRDRLFDSPDFSVLVAGNEYSVKPNGKWTHAMAITRGVEPPRVNLIRCGADKADASTGAPTAFMLYEQRQ